MTGRFVATNLPRPRWRFNAAYGVTERLLIGVEYNAVVGEYSPTANYTLMFESERTPFVSLGTSSDRIFSPPGKQAYYVTLGKSIPNTQLAPYLTFQYSTWEQRMIVPFGINCSLGKSWDAMVQHDGRNTHWLLTWKSATTSVSLLLVKGRYWGVSTGFRF